MRRAGGRDSLLALAAALPLALPAAPLTAAPKNSPAAYRMAGDFASLIGRCWFGKGRSTFPGYAHASETNAIVGPPRVLLVDKKAPHGRPALVIEFRTSGGAVDISVYGPLAAGAKAATIEADLNRWASGGKECAP